jgi:hypothetical protein
MLEDITTGNTVTDGRDFRFWVVGEIEKWCKEINAPFDRERFGLRNSKEIEIKWGVYSNGDVRSAWASCSGRIGMSILIRGDSTFNFRNINDHTMRREVRLKTEGDYVIWKENVEHTWRINEDSVFLTLRWLPAG